MPPDTAVLTTHRLPVTVKVCLKYASYVPNCCKGWSVQPCIASMLLVAGSWSSKDKNKNQWIQADLRTAHRLESVITRGRPGHDQWVKSYYISYSQDGTNWVDIPTLYSGNTDRDTKKTNNLPPNTAARYVRLRPNDWETYISMRWEVTGCDCKLEVNK